MNLLPGYISESILKTWTENGQTAKVDLMEKNAWIMTPEHERISDSVLYVPYV